MRGIQPNQLSEAIQRESQHAKENLGGAEGSPAGVVPFLCDCVPNRDPRPGQYFNLPSLRPKVAEQCQCSM